MLRCRLDCGSVELAEGEVSGDWEEEGEAIVDVAGGEMRLEVVPGKFGLWKEDCEGVGSGP